MPNKLPLVSIIIVNWNGEAYIRECLNSLFNQSYRNYEIIVVDNGSSDDSPQILKDYVPQIKLILGDKNLGFAGGNNVGIKEASGQFVVLFNNDAIADKDWLSNLVSGLLETPEADIASGPIYYYEPKDIIWCAGARLDMVTGLAWHPDQYEMEFELCQDIDYFPGCALLIKREVFDKIGLLDERFFLYGEDPDFCLRAKGAGFKLKLVPHAKVWHMVSIAMKREPEPTQERKLNSEFKLILKLWPRWCLPITLSLRLSIIPLLERNLRLTWRAYHHARKEKVEAYRAENLPLRIRFRECLHIARMRRKGSNKARGMKE